MEKDYETNKGEQPKIEIFSTTKKGKIKSNKVWLVQIFFVSLCLSVLFALISELMLANASLALALFLIVLLVGVSVVFDLIGMAVTACSIKPLLDLNQKGERGADIAIKLVKNADRISCICTDVVGDICSILSGAGGVAISVILISFFPQVNSIILSILISSIIASVSVLGKAIGKTYALNYPIKVVLNTAKVLSLFKKSKKNSNGKNHKK